MAWLSKAGAKIWYNTKYYLLNCPQTKKTTTLTTLHTTTWLLTFTVRTIIQFNCLEEYDKKCRQACKQTLYYLTISEGHWWPQNWPTDLEVKVNNVLLVKMTKTFENLSQKHGRRRLVHLLTSSEVFKQLTARHPNNIVIVIIIIIFHSVAVGQLVYFRIFLFHIWSYMAYRPVLDGTPSFAAS